MAAAVLRAHMRTFKNADMFLYSFLSFFVVRATIHSFLLRDMEACTSNVPDACPTSPYLAFAEQLSNSLDVRRHKAILVIGLTFTGREKAGRGSR